MLFVLLPDSHATLDALAERVLQALPDFACTLDPNAREWSTQETRGS